MKKVLMALAALAVLGGTSLALVGNPTQAAPTEGACGPCDPSQCGPCPPCCVVQS